MIKRKFDLFVTAVCLALLGYFAWYGLRDRAVSIFAMIWWRNPQAACARNSADLEAQRATLESRVQLMRPESVDPDLLDELARSDLDFSQPDDLILRFSQ